MAKSTLRKFIFS